MSIATADAEADGAPDAAPDADPDADASSEPYGQAKNYTNENDDYGVTWMYIPDGDGVPQIAYLTEEKPAGRGRKKNVKDAVRFELYTKWVFSTILNLWPNSLNSSPHDAFDTHTARKLAFECFRRGSKNVLYSMGEIRLKTNAKNEPTTTKTKQNKAKKNKKK